HRLHPHKVGSGRAARVCAGPREGVALMETHYWVLLIGLAAMVALGTGYFLARFQDHLQHTSARASRDELLGQARLEADNIKKEAELKVKDSVLKEREQFNKDVGTKQGEIREQERRLEKKEDLLEQKHQAQQKKERELDHVKKKLIERRDLLDKR